MTEETAPNPHTFDLADVLSGRTFPERTVDVFMDEKAAYLIYLADAEIRTASEAEVEELEKHREGLAKAAETSKLTFHLRGVSRTVREEALNSTIKEFPIENDFLGRPKANPEADRKFAAAQWALGPDEHNAELIGATAHRASAVWRLNEA